MSPPQFIEVEKLKQETAEITAKIIKSAPFLNSAPSNETLQMLLNELRMMRMDIKEMKENQKNLQDDVTRNQETLEEVQREQQNQKDIRQQIHGKWRDVDRHWYSFSSKFEGDTFMIKWNTQPCYKKYKIGGKHKNGLITSIENNKIVRRTLTDDGEEKWRFELGFENGRLIKLDSESGELHPKYTLERFGEPDPE